MNNTLPKFLTGQRVKLQDVIPLQYPFSMFIESAATCNLRCKFCFHGNREELARNKVSLGLMDMGTYKKIIADLKSSGKSLKVLYLFNRGEPLLNKHLPEMVAIAKDNGVAETISITTNAILLNKGMADALVDAGIDSVRISIEALSADGYKENCGVRVDFTKLVEQIQYFYAIKGSCYLYIKAIKELLSPDEQTRFLEIFESCADECFLENMQPLWHQSSPDYGEQPLSQLDFLGIKKKETQVCPHVFFKFAINWKGDILPCANDYLDQYVLGNISNTSVLDAWGSEGMNRLRRINLKKQRESLPLCQGCVAPTACSVDDIDDYAEMLLQRIA